MAVDKIDGRQVTISNRGQLVLPTPVEVKFKDGTNTRLKLPVETWLSKGTMIWNAPNGKEIESVVVDPDHMLPDDNRTNNERKASP